MIEMELTILNGLKSILVKKIDEIEVYRQNLSIYTVAIGKY